MSAKPEQNLAELLWLKEQVRGLHSLLEIGSRSGDTLLALAETLAPGARICSIDLGMDVEGYSKPPSAGVLGKTITELRNRGFDAECLIGDSKELEAIAWAKRRAPFDFIFIDGDHTFEGCRADWMNYGHMGKVVGFHDICNGNLGVCLLWHVIKLKHNVVERIANPNNMGIGVVFQEQYRAPGTE